MTPNRVTVAMEKFQNQVPEDGLIRLREALVNATDECMDDLMYMKLKSKGVVLLFSILLSGLGAARFYIGDTGLGVARLSLNLLNVLFLQGVPVIGPLLTLGILIWGIADIFLTYRAVKEVNLDRIMTFLRSHRAAAPADTESVGTL